MRFKHFWQRPINVWRPWFAWRPVWIGDEFVWLERVEYQITIMGSADDGSPVYETKWRHAVGNSS
jgi:hypothetical protein